jgi:hypothetical protein
MARKRPESGHKDGASLESQIQAATKGVSQAIESISTRPEGQMWFPNGITKIDLTIKYGGFEFTVGAQGPDVKSSAHPSSGMTTEGSRTSDLTFTIDQVIGGRKARGTLSWPAEGLSSRATSGDSGHDHINPGTWTGIAFQERPSNDAPYCDVNNNCWFSVFRDQFGRTGMGIHPDGGTADATAGCIGLQASDTRLWHDKLKAKNGLITCFVTLAVNFTSSRDDGVTEKYVSDAAARVRTNKAVHLECVDDEGGKFSLDFLIPGNKWEANLPVGTKPVFKTRSGVWQRAINITTLYKKDATTRVGALNPFVPESAQKDEVGKGKCEETGEIFDWRVTAVA